MSMDPARTWSPCRWLSTLFGGYGYAAFVTLPLQPGCRRLIVCSADVRPEHRGNGGHRSFRQQPLPSITVQAPKPLARPHRTAPRAVARPAARRTMSRETSPADTTQPGGQGSVLERLHRLERETDSCDDGCQSSFPKGNRPWVGCSVSAFPQPSAGCGNPRHFTSYVQCTDYVTFLAWLRRDAWWYCSNLALNK